MEFSLSYFLHFWIQRPFLTIWTFWLFSAIFCFFWNFTLIFAWYFGNYFAILANFVNFWPIFASFVIFSFTWPFISLLGNSWQNFGRFYYFSLILVILLSGTKIKIFLTYKLFYNLLFYKQLFLYIFMLQKIKDFKIFCTILLKLKLFIIQIKKLLFYRIIEIVMKNEKIQSTELNYTE